MKRLLRHFRAARPHRPRAFSLVEMLAAVAALVILLGLMVSLARYVRRQASEQLTRQLLAQLDLVMQRYKARYQAVPNVPSFVGGTVVQAQGGGGQPGTGLLSPAGDDALPDEQTLHDNAAANSRALLAVLRVESRRHPDEYVGLPPAVLADGPLLDAWGTPIVFMPALHPAVGIAMENRPFFLSAGPDRLFRTPQNNLYSYEEDVERAEAK